MATYGEGFEPDFIFFGKPKEGADLGYLSVEMIIESKGAGFYLKDEWKEDLILDESILNKKVFTCSSSKNIDEKIEFNLYALPFFFGKNEANSQEFKKQFYEFF